MLIFKRFLIWLVPIFTLIAFKLIFFNPRWIYWILPALALFLVFIIWHLNNYQLKKFKIFLITPLILLFSSTLFVAFLKTKTLKYFIVLVLAVFLAVFLETLFLSLYKPDRYQIGSLENISGYLNLISLFFLVSGLYGLLIFLVIPLWILALVLLVVSALLTYEIMAVSEILFSKSWSYIIIFSLILLELFWVISFLPTSVYVNGLIIALAYYVMAGLSRNWLLGNLEKSVIKRYLLVSLVCFIVILITAKWS